MTGRLDAFEWRVPMERLAQVIEGEEDFAPAQTVRAAIAAPQPEVQSGLQPGSSAAEEAVIIEAVPAETRQKPASSPEPAVKREAVKPVEPAPANGGDETSKDAAKTILPPPPDDPGVDPDEANGSTSPGFRLF